MWLKKSESAFLSRSDELLTINSLLLFMHVLVPVKLHVKGEVCLQENYRYVEEDMMVLETATLRILLHLKVFLQVIWLKDFEHMAVCIIFVFSATESMKIFLQLPC